MPRITITSVRWLTVVSPEDPDGTELLLEPDGHPAAKPFKQALREDPRDRGPRRARVPDRLDRDTTRPHRHETAGRF